MATKQEVYEHLRYRTITNELRAGQQLYEKELMEEYGIGRTPLREIFQELQRNGLVEIIPKLGTRVVNLDMRTLRESIQLRRELEGLAAELAVRNMEQIQVRQLEKLLKQAADAESGAEDSLKTLSDIDIDIHQIIYEASGNRQLKSILESLLLKMSMYWFQVGFSASDFHEQFDELHEFLQAASNRDGSAAREVMRRHIDHFTSLIKENFV